MSHPVRIKDSRSGYEAYVTRYNQLVIGQLDFDSASYKELDVINTAYNFYKPEAGKNFIITFIDIQADKQVSSSVSADVVIYEASAPDTTTVDKIIYQTGLAQDQAKALPVQLLVNEGKFVNGKTTDDDVHINIFGYYVDAPNG